MIQAHDGDLDPFFEPWQQAEAYRQQAKSSILSLPDSLLEILPLIDQKLQHVRKAQALV